MESGGLPGRDELEIIFRGLLWVGFRHCSLGLEGPLSNKAVARVPFLGCDLRPIPDYARNLSAKSAIASKKSTRNLARWLPIPW